MVPPPFLLPPFSRYAAGSDGGEWSGQIYSDERVDAADDERVLRVGEGVCERCACQRGDAGALSLRSTARPFSAQPECEGDAGFSGEILLFIES